MEDDPKILSEAEIEEGLKSLRSWKREGGKISKEFGFKDFLSVLEFVNNMAPYFQQQDHHPDINWSYKKIIFSLTRYSAGKKLTNKDFKIANEIEKRYAELFQGRG